ncbi:hypothetical protein OGAPHI_000816 [Ogataea philodendri]|uniref:Uncharacterized protein n=1 Tax=Ogataea philodendri TaxID=1378263 RepID=A0A9P8TA89_9ASCO|nr:uncharacterized protein OGAPHI_000816 [Ogataea philodendri]KAH3671105.1 hypothetical protein OGAPHI_000816 [Ogataea philodendri]
MDSSLFDLNSVGRRSLVLWDSGSDGVSSTMGGWVLDRVQLVVLLGVPECLDWLDHSDDLVIRIPFFLGLLQRLAGDFILLLAMGEDGRSVLGSNVWTLVVELGWVVDQKEKVHKTLVRNLSRFVRDLQRLCVVGGISANGFVIWVLKVSISVTNLGVQDLSVELLVINVLNAPETASSNANHFAGRSSLQRLGDGRHGEK